MATLNFAHRELTARVVYFGAAGAGADANVRALHKLVPSSSRSQLHKFGPRDTDARTYYFDHAADGQEINGFHLRFGVYSLASDLLLPAHREEVMRDVDAIVFVADARPEGELANLEALLDLERMLTAVGVELATVPMILQVNHTDHADARRPEHVTFDLNPYGFHVVAASTEQGDGVIEAHAALTAAVSARIRESLSGAESAITLVAVHRPERYSDAEVVRGHLEQIQAHTASLSEEGLEDTLGGDPAGRAAAPRGEHAGEVRVPFQPRELVGSWPVQVLGAEVRDDVVVLELLVARRNGEDPRALTVVLENRPADTPPLPRPTASSPPPERDRLADYLPDSYDPKDEREDLPPVVYGLMGLAGGVLIGLLAGYLVGVVT